jgi:hypothetical protein
VSGYAQPAPGALARGRADPCPMGSAGVNVRLLIASMASIFGWIEWE